MHNELINGECLAGGVHLAELMSTSYYTKVFHFNDWWITMCRCDNPFLINYRSSTCIVQRWWIYPLTHIKDTKYSSVIIINIYFPASNDNFQKLSTIVNKKKTYLNENLPWKFMRSRCSSSYDIVRILWTITFAAIFSRYKSCQKANRHNGNVLHLAMFSSQILNVTSNLLYTRSQVKFTTSEEELTEKNETFS